MDTPIVRRRLASLLVVAVAASASLATSATPPTPPPSVDNTVKGTLELSAKHPVAVRPIHVRLTGLDAKSIAGRPPTITLTPSPTVISFGPAGEGEIRTSVARAEPEVETSNEEPGVHFRSLLDLPSAPRGFDLTCGNTTCEGRFALIVDTVNRTVAEPVSVDWQVSAHVELWGGAPVGRQPVVEMTVDEPAPIAAGAAQATATVTEAKATADNVRLDLTHRLAMWRLALTLGDEPLVDKAGWPLVVTARLTPRNTVVAAPPNTSPEPQLFIEGAGDEWNIGTEVSRSHDAIWFEPFWACVPGEVCTAEYTIGLAQGVLVPDETLDSGWDLEVRAVSTDGHSVPVEAVVTRIPEMPMISATVHGTFVTGSDGGSGDLSYTVSEQSDAKRDPQWDGLRTPTYGIFRATMRSTGSAPLPTDSFSVTYGPRGFDPALKLDEEGVFGFAPGGPRCRVPDCDLSSEFAAGIGYRNGTLKPGWQVTVDWELELGMGTSAIDGDSMLIVKTFVPPTSSP